MHPNRVERKVGDMGKRVDGFLGFQEARTGLPVGLLVEARGDHGMSYSLAPQDRATRMHYKADDLETLRSVLAEDRDGWQTSERLPGWGSYAPDELLPVRFEIVTSFAPVDLRGAAPIVRVRSRRDVPRGVVRQWAPEVAGALPDEPAFVLALGNSEEGEALVDRIGGKVILEGGSLMRKSTLVAALPLEERHSEMAETGRADCILVCLPDLREAALDVPGLKAACRACWDRVPAAGPTP